MCVSETVCMSSGFWLNLHSCSPRPHLFTDTIDRKDDHMAKPLNSVNGVMCIVFKQAPASFHVYNEPLESSVALLMIRPYV